MDKEIAYQQKGEYLVPVSYTGRYENIQTLFDRVVFNGVYQAAYSRGLDCHPYRHFTLYLHLVSVGEGMHYICFMPQFNDQERGEWCDYPQGLFAALCFEDVDTAAGIDVCFSGDCAGRQFRLRILEHETSKGLYFTVTARVEFWS